MTQSGIVLSGLTNANSVMLCKHSRSWSVPDAMTSEGSSCASLAKLLVRFVGLLKRFTNKLRNLWTINFKTCPTSVWSAEKWQIIKVKASSLHVQSVKSRAQISRDRVSSVQQGLIFSKKRASWCVYCVWRVFALKMCQGSFRWIACFVMMNFKRFIFTIHWAKWDVKIVFVSGI